MKLRAYDDCKPSGVEWLGNVPKHWDTKPMRRLGDAIIGLTYSPENVVQENEGVLVLRSSNLQGGRITRDDNVFVNAAVPDELRTRTGDILICSRNGSRDLVGKCARVFPSDAGLTFGAFTTVFRSDHSDFLFYVLNSSLFSFQAGLYQTSTIYQLTTGTLDAMIVPIPPKTEQRAIVDFLDRETARLDALVGKKRELIEKLKEKRTALISRIVTRGLNPAAKLKPSGIEWLGDIPTHWESSRVGYGVTKIGSGKTPRGGSETYQSEGVMLIRSQNVYDDGLRLDGVVYIDDETDEEMSGTRVQTGDVLLNITGASLGRCAIVPASVGRANVNQHVCIIRPEIAKTDSRFLRQALISQTTKAQIFADEAGSSREGLNFQQVRDLRLAIPPRREQEIVANYLDRETAKIDKMIEKVEAAIEKLREYRTALITAAVTGKIDVMKN